MARINYLNPHETCNFVRGVIANPQAAFLLGGLYRHHRGSFFHNVRVGMLGVDLGIELGLSSREMHLLAYAGTLHDIGKLGISEDVLSAQRSLTSTEYDLMAAHPRLSRTYILEGLTSFPEYEHVAQIAVMHHEFTKHVDGRTPYPRSQSRGLSGNDIVDKLVQIVVVADLIDGLAHARSYRSGLSKVEIECIARTAFEGDRLYVDHVMKRVE